MLHTCKNWFNPQIHDMLLKFAIHWPFSSLRCAPNSAPWSIISSLRGHNIQYLSTTWSITLMVFSVFIFSNSPPARIFREHHPELHILWCYLFHLRANQYVLLTCYAFFHIGPIYVSSFSYHLLLPDVLKACACEVYYEVYGYYRYFYDWFKHSCPELKSVECFLDDLRFLNGNWFLWSAQVIPIIGSFPVSLYSFHTDLHVVLISSYLSNCIAWFSFFLVEEDISHLFLRHLHALRGFFRAKISGKFFRDYTPRTLVLYTS